MKMEDVVARVEKMRRDGTLARAVRSSGVTYGLTKDGNLYAEYSDGRRLTGRFLNGRFVAD